MSNEKGRPERGGAKADQAEKTGKPAIPRDAVQDLEPPKETADSVKGGITVRKAGGKQEE